MKAGISIGIAIAVFALFPSISLAEVYLCDGKWTNKPCSGEITKSIEEQGSQIPADPSRQLLREKTSILHELRMKNLKAKSDFDIRYDIGGIEGFCLKQASPIEECRQKVKKASDELDQKMVSASSVLTQKRSIALQEEANRLQAERNQIEENRPNITVLERERPIIIVPRDGRYPRGYSSHGHTAGSAGISISGSNASGTVSGTVSGSTTTTTGHGQVAPIIMIPPPAPRPQSGVTVYDNNGTGKRLEGVKPGPFAR